MKHIFLFAVFAALSFHMDGRTLGSLSDEGEYTAQSVMDQTYIPSPESYAMAQYVETPVSYYTGVPDISIPLYTIKVDEFELPISLKYHASGIKVAQEASRVGLGWSLHAGGEITRVVQDRDDIHIFWDDYRQCNEKGYWADTTAFDRSWDGMTDGVDDNGNYFWLDDYHECVDSEPDIFYFNFCGYQGTFFARKGAGADSSIKEKWLLQNKESGLHIDYFYKGGRTAEVEECTEGYFIVTSSDGTKYKFEEHNEVSSCGACRYEADTSSEDRFPSLDTFYNPDGMVLNPLGISRSTVITTWYLTEIELVSGEKITFCYDEESYYSPLFESRSANELIKSEFVNSAFPEQKQAVLNMQNIRMSLFHSVSATLVNRQHILKKIAWEGGCIDFLSPEIRYDVRKVPDTGTKTHSEYASRMLSEINVCSMAGTDKRIVNTYRFHHSYFGGSANSGNTESYLHLRLRLDSLSVYGNGNACQQYRMTYNMDCDLPAKNSERCDKWGYYAGYSNPYYEIYTVRKNWLRYRNAKPDFLKMGEKHRSTIPTAQYPDPESAKAWILTGLTTPTGGTTRYFYEGNAINETLVLDSLKISEVTFTSDRATVSIPDSEISESDTCSFTMDISTDCGYLELDCYCEAGTPEHLTTTDIFTVYDSEGRMLHSQTGIPSDAKVENYSMTLYSFNVCIPVHEEGQYRVLLPKNRKWIKKVELKCKEFKTEVRDSTVTTGGLRISRIESPVCTRNFSYMADNISSGQLNRSPIYTHPLYWETLNALMILFHMDYYLHHSSAPCQPLANPVTGGYMGYSRVQESVTDGNGETVKKEYRYYNREEEKIENWYDNGSIQPLNGIPSQEILYDKNGDMLRKTIWDYRDVPCDTIWGRTHKEGSYGQELYSWYSYETQLAAKKEITTGSDDSVCDTLTTVYAYQSSSHLPSSILTRSGYDVKEERMTYSADYENGVWEAMKTRHMLVFPVTKSIYLSGKLVSRDILLYSPECLYKPGKRFSFSGREDEIPGMDSLNDYEAESTSVYDSKGRLVQVTSWTGLSMVLLWSYSRQYIIAQISNATLEDIRQNGIDIEALAAKAKPSDADWTALENLRRTLPESEVVTCKYLPLTGIVERTDGQGRKAVYTYDSFNRLERESEVKDGRMIPVRQYEYHLETERQEQP